MCDQVHNRVGFSFLAYQCLPLGDGLKKIKIETEDRYIL